MMGARCAHVGNAHTARPPETTRLPVMRRDPPDGSRVIMTAFAPRKTSPGTTSISNPCMDRWSIPAEDVVPLLTQT